MQLKIPKWFYIFTASSTWQWIGIYVTYKMIVFVSISCAYQHISPCWCAIEELGSSRYVSLVWIDKAEHNEKLLKIMYLLSVQGKTKTGLKFPLRSSFKREKPFLNAKFIETLIYWIYMLIYIKQHVYLKLCWIRCLVFCA